MPGASLWVHGQPLRPCLCEPDPTPLSHTAATQGPDAKTNFPSDYQPSSGGEQGPPTPLAAAGEGAQSPLPCAATPVAAVQVSPPAAASGHAGMGQEGEREEGRALLTPAAVGSAEDGAGQPTSGVDEGQQLVKLQTGGERVLSAEVEADGEDPPLACSGGTGTAAAAAAAYVLVEDAPWLEEGERDGVMRGGGGEFFWGVSAAQQHCD